MDLIEEFTLPSGGSIYGKEVNPSGRIRAPRLCDKGIGDLSRRNKIQAETLNKTILEPGIGIDCYDLHTSDFVYLNMIQRMASRGKDMDLTVTCGKCGRKHQVTVDLSKVEIKKPNLPFDLTYETHDGDTLKLRFFTPRLLDQIRENTENFKEEFPAATQDVGLQELCRALIVEVNGEKRPHSWMTSYLLNSYEVDLMGIVNKVTATNFGPSLIRKMKCENSRCKSEIVYSISPDNG